MAKPEDVKAPIWCSISPDNCLKPIPDTVVYVLEVPQDQIIYFDDVKWDYVLNRIYLPKDDEDAAAYKRHLKEIGVENGFEFFEGRYKGMFPEEVERIRASWKRVFEIDNWTIFNVCGNIWEIKKEWVKRICAARGECGPVHARWNAGLARISRSHPSGGRAEYEAA
ncbi:MAG: DUF3841 domain-containing protein [[Clostridium] scindens]